MDCYFTVQEAKQILNGLEAWQEANQVDLFGEILTNVCREIIRLNEVIEQKNDTIKRMIPRMDTLSQLEFGHDSRQCPECE